MMKRRRIKLLFGAGLVATTATVVAVRAIRRKRRRQILPKAVRHAVSEVLTMRGHDFLSEGSLGESLFRRRMERLDDRQLVMVFALAQLGHLAREKGIDPLHPTKEQVVQALETLAKARQEAPLLRKDVLGQLESETPASLKEALSVALGLLSHAQ